MTIEIHPAIVAMNPRIVDIPEGKKSPITPGWPKIQTRVQDVDGKHAGVSYGIILDEEMLAIDVDTHDPSKNGWEALDRLSDDLGCDLLDKCSLVVSSPSGGAHLYFIKDDNMAAIPKSTKRYAGLDFLSIGCQVLGPGSKHISGGTYKVTSELNGKQPSAPSFIDSIGLSAVLDSYVAPEPEYEHVEILQEDSPIDEMNTTKEGLDLLVGELKANGYTIVPKQDHYEFTRPGKNDFTFAISGTVGRKNTRGNYYLKCFSTADANFEAESYNIAEALRILNNISRDDFPKYLRDKGFGAPLAPSISKEEFEQFYQEWYKGREHERPASTYSHLTPKHLIPKTLTGEELDKLYPTFTLADLRDRTSGGKRRDYLIDGLLRRGEVMNVIAAPKVGKSWLTYHLALAVTCGKEFMGYKAKERLKVLIVDNELHAEELTWRVGQVADALKVDPEDRLQFSLLRGSSVDIDGLDSKLDEAGGSGYDIIVIDAFYRILPKGMSENDNASMTQIYNRLDSLAKKNSASIINIHHSSKGNQGDKGVTDVGAGAGAISRAADVHMVIRQHVEDKHVVIEAVTRSGKSPDPVTAEFKFPLWHHKPEMDPTVKNFDNARKKVNDDRKSDADSKMKHVRDAILAHQNNGVYPNSSELYEECKLITGWTDKTFKSNLRKMCDKGVLKAMIPTPGSLAKRYAVIDE